MTKTYTQKEVIALLKAIQKDLLDEVKENRKEMKSVKADEDWYDCIILDQTNWVLEYVSRDIIKRQIDILTKEK